MINYASKFDPKVVERFKLNSLTEAAINRDYKWEGVKTVSVYSYPVYALEDYTPSGVNRYGTPQEQDNTIQEMTVAKDRSKTITVDRMTLDDTAGTATGNKILSRQINEIYIPEVDVYRIAAMATAAVANGATDTAAITKNNAYISLLKGTEWMGDKKVPANKRVAFVTYAFYSFIKQDPSFMLASEISKQELINGQVGKVDGAKIVAVPSSYLPSNTAFVMCHPAATTGVTKLEDYKIHTDPPGISGLQIDMRFRYDAFVLDAKKDALYIHKIA